MLTRMLVVIAFLACNSNAAPLQSSSSPQDPLDLEVITLDSQGNPIKTVYYSYDQLLTLPTVTVKTDRDPNTNTPATSKDNFRRFVIDPHSIDPMSQMPPHPTFDTDTFNALEAYFKAMMPIEIRSNRGGIS